MKFHKNLHIVALLAAMFALDAQAASVSRAQAMRAVSAWASANGSAFAEPGEAVSAEAVSENGTNLYWIVKMSNGGAVIASPDTNIDLVIAVLEKYDGPFPAGHPLPAILRRDMLNRLSVIGASPSSTSASASVSGMSLLSSSASSQASSVSEDLPEAVKASVKEANAQWEKYSASSGMSLLGNNLVGGDESPYVRRIVDGFEEGGVYTHWNQAREPLTGQVCYNYYTPENVVCGCAATAAAAVMQFFGCTTDVGEIPGNDCKFNGYYHSCMTKPGAIDWSILPTNGLSDVLSTLSTNEAARELVGRVTYNMGVLIDMAWAEGGSGAWEQDIPQAFKTNGFVTARHVDLLKAGDSGLYKFVYSQTWANAPVILGIENDEGAHAVVACGYAKDPDGDEFCRVFMGWGGSGDAWYKFPEIREYNVVRGVVTMIGYEDDAVVPVCGRSNSPGSKFTINGFETAGEPVEEGEEPVSSPVVIECDDNGYFAVRVPVGLSNPVLTDTVTGKSLGISPFKPPVLKDESSEVDKLMDAMPGEVLFLGLDMVTKFTVESAWATALRDGKAVLMVSGSGSVREELLIDYLTYLDGTTDMSNRFVFVHLNSGDYSSLASDGDPTIGVFDPSVGSANEGWHDGNGRLSYSTFIDYSADNQDSLNYIFDESDTTALTNTVLQVLDTGYDTYSRTHSGISVTVSAVHAESGYGFRDDSLPQAWGFMETLRTNAAVLALSPDGVFTNCWTNGEAVVFSVPEACTNLEYGVAYRCVGCVLNGTDMTNRTVSLELSADDEIELVWLWDVKAYRIDSYVSGLSDAPEDAVTPVEEWRPYGDRVTISAVKSHKGFLLDYWDVSCAVDDMYYDTVYDGDYYPYAWIAENGNTISFCVYEPVYVTAYYSKDCDEVSDPVEYDVSISVNPPELAEILNADASLSEGDNTTYDPYASFMAHAADIPGSTNGVEGTWSCVGWVEDGVTNSIDTLAGLDASAKTEIELVWEFRETPAEPETVLPEPGDISISGVEAVADGSWKITVSGAVKDCWYWLYSSDELSAMSGAFSGWTAAKADVVSGTNPQQAAEDGDIVFNVPASGEKLFWRARATSTETGEK